MEQVLAECHVQPGTALPQTEQILPEWSVQPGAASAQESPAPYATHALVFMLARVAPREKEVVGYHFTGKIL